MCVLDCCEGGLCGGAQLFLLVLVPRAHKLKGASLNLTLLSQGKCYPVDTSSSISQGWMNEIHSYDPEMYHATLTHSVYVRLEGSVLRLSKPNRNISRRATHNEPKPDVTYISQKIYDLSDSKVHRH